MPIHSSKVSPNDFQPAQFGSNVDFFAVGLVQLALLSAMRSAATSFNCFRGPESSNFGPQLINPVAEVTSLCPRYPRTIKYSPAILLLHQTLVLVKAVVGAADKSRSVGAVLVAQCRRAAVGCRDRDHVLATCGQAELTFRSGVVKMWVV